VPAINGPAVGVGLIMTLAMGIRFAARGSSSSASSSMYNTCSSPMTRSLALSLWRSIAADRPAPLSMAARTKRR
jgi:hypothetical protein